MAETFHCRINEADRENTVYTVWQECHAKLPKCNINFLRGQLGDKKSVPACKTLMHVANRWNNAASNREPTDAQICNCFRLVPEIVGEKHLTDCKLHASKSAESAHAQWQQCQAAGPSAPSSFLPSGAHGGWPQDRFPLPESERREHAL